MIIRPLILRMADGADGGAAVAEAAPAPSAPAATPGPRPFLTNADATPAPSIRESLNRNGNPDPNAPPPKTAKPPEAKAAPKETPPKKEEAAPAAPSTPPDPSKAPPPKADKTEKANPWKLRDAEKARADQAEAKLREYESQQLNPRERSEYEATKKRNEELENEIRFASWKKSKDYEKVFTPYNEKWQETLTLIGKIPITDKATGIQRPGNEQDLMELFVLNPVEADARALEMVGGSATLAARLLGNVEKCQELSAAVAKAEQDATANGKTREEQRLSKNKSDFDRLEKAVRAWHKESDDEWAKDPDAATFGEIKARDDGKGFTPEETAQNESIARGRELASIFDKTLKDFKTPDEVKAFIKKRRAAVNRSIYFGAVRKLYHSTLKKLQAAEKELASYKETKPVTGGRNGNGGNPAQTDFRTSIRSALESRSGRR